MKKNVIKTAVAAVCVVAAGMGGFKAYNVAAQSETDMLLAENVEALSSCDAYASASTKVLWKTITASAYLECKGSKGTCCIPSNDYGLTASCSGKQVSYVLKVNGKRVN